MLRRPGVGGGVVSEDDDGLNVAVTVTAAVTVTLQEPVPEQPPPLQPVKVEPAAGVAVRDRERAVEGKSEELGPQGIPAGELVTGPRHVPAFANGRTTFGAGAGA